MEAISNTRTLKTTHRANKTHAPPLSLLVMAVTMQLVLLYPLIRLARGLRYRRNSAAVVSAMIKAASSPTSRRRGSASSSSWRIAGVALASACE